MWEDGDKERTLEDPTPWLSLKGTQPLPQEAELGRKWKYQTGDVAPVEERLPSKAQGPECKPQY
jgi:hypothetical protein